MNPDRAYRESEGVGCVAGPMPSKDQLVSKSETNSTDYKEIVNQLVLLSETNLGLASPRKIEAFFKKIKKFMNPTRMAICHYIKMNRATTRDFIAYDLDIPSQTVARHIKQLQKWKIIHVSGQITRRGKKGVKGGPRPEILSFDAPNPDDIARCRSRYYKECNVGIEVAKKLTQLIIEEYVDTFNEVKYGDLFQKVKKEAIGFDPLPIADEVAYNLHKLGVKVWK